MTITTTIKAGDLPQTINLPEGQALTLSGSAGTVGVAYLLDQVLGGTNSLKSWAIGQGALPAIGGYAGTQQILISCTAGSITATSGDAALSGLSTVSDSKGRVVGGKVGGVSIPLPFASPRGRMVFIGDSLTYQGSPQRAPGFFDGSTYWPASGVFTNLGGGNWIVYCLMGGASAMTGGTLRTDGAGRLQWQYTGDADYGPLVDVSAGGWYKLQSSTATNTILVAVRGATTPPASIGTGAVTASGLPMIGDYDLRGYVAWVAGALGSTFADYQAWAISGATTADAILNARQALATDAEVVVITIGINDPLSNASDAATSIAQHKTLIDYCADRARRVYVVEVFPNPSGSAANRKYGALVQTAVRDYCRTKSNTVFVPTYDLMINKQAYQSSASAVTGLTGVFDSGNLHLMPYGGYRASLRIVQAIARDYAIDLTRRTTSDFYDSGVTTGAWNANQCLRGTGGTVTASNGITGTAPDGHTLARSGTTQLCTTSFDAAADGGLDWWSMAVSGATAGDYHKLNTSSYVSVPAGVNVGDYFRIVAELCIFGSTTPGLAIFQIQANANASIQNAYLLQTNIASGHNIDTFSTENPVLLLQSEPQKLLPGTAGFDMVIRIGAATGGGAGKVGLRLFRIEKCDGPIYP
jgi:hypothetical protein